MTYRYKEPKTEKPKPKTSFPFTGPDGKVHIAKRARFEENGIPYEIFHAEDEYEVWLVTDPATHPVRLSAQDGNQLRRGEKPPHDARGDAAPASRDSASPGRHGTRNDALRGRDHVDVAAATEDKED